MSKVLVPVDGSDCSLRALQQAVQWAKSAPGTEVVVLNVQAPIVSGHARMFLSKSDIQTYHELEGKEVLDKVKPVLEASGVPHSSTMRVGHLAETIVEYGREQKCDSIMMGTRGLGEVAGLLLGSVTRKVIHLAEVPITLVK